MTWSDGLATWLPSRKFSLKSGCESYTAFVSYATSLVYCSYRFFDVEILIRSLDAERLCCARNSHHRHYVGSTLHTEALSCRGFPSSRCRWKWLGAQHLTSLTRTTVYCSLESVCGIRYQVDEEEFSEALALLRDGRGTQAEAEAMWLHIARRKTQIGFEHFCVSTTPP